MYLDVKAPWARIKSRAIEGIQTLFPLSSQNKTLVLDSVEFKEPEGSVAQQRDALLRGESLNALIYGNFSLKDNKGKHLDSAKIKILDLPILTQRGTFVVKGKDYSVFNQVRLRPGVYTRQVEGSDAVSARFNLAKGIGFRINLEPSTSVFYIQFDASSANTGGQSKIPLYSLLRTLGVSDEMLEREWGKELAAANKDKVKGNIAEDAHKIVQHCVYKTLRTGNDAKDLMDYFETTVLSGETTKITLGNSHKKVTVGALLDASKKLVKVYKGEANGDDLDSLLFKEVLSAEDHIMLRISKGAKQPNGPLYKIRRKLDGANSVKECVPLNFLTKLIESFFTSSSLASPQTEINPIEILETGSKLTPMGEGGIKSEHGIPMSARNLHPSHFGFIDPVRTTESLRVGIDNRAAHHVTFKDRNIYGKFLDKNGKEVELKPIELAGKVVAFAGQENMKIVKAMIDEEIKEVPRDKVDYWMASARDMFACTPNLVPFMHNDQGNRVTMSSRFLTQAVPLVHREAPLVQVKGSGNDSFEKEIAEKYLAPVAPKDGTVRDITNDYIKIDDVKVDLYTNFPLNYKCQINMYPKVKLGDKVKKGQVLADSNFTKDGVLALGTNLRTAYLPYKGWTHEDAIVISESAAEKLTSEHMYTEELELSPKTMVDKDKYAMSFPSKITAEQLKLLDAEGVARKGVTLQKGDYVITALGERKMTEADILIQRLKPGLATQYRDASIVWHHDRPGTVTDVIRTGKLIKVVLLTQDKTRLGDKLSNRHGGKGTVTLILPDKEMPYTKDGKPLDMMLNPAGVISRVNPGQLYETMAGKKSKVTGKPYIVENFRGKDTSKELLEDLDKHGIKMTETVIDPVTNKPLGDVFVGEQYALKLHKQTEGNFAARFKGSYDANLQPAKGGEKGSKALGLQDFYALLGHNARGMLKEVSGYKNQQNEEFWDAVRLGKPIPPAKTPFVFHKLQALMGATGINVTEHGRGEDRHFMVSPLTDKDVLSRSSGKVNNALMMKGNVDDMVPEVGGIFDEALTGGLQGTNWTHIDLAEPIHHPLFTKQLKVMLGGKNPEEMKGKEIHAELSKINVDKRIEELKADLKVLKSTKRDKALKELRYLIGMKTNGIHPKDLVLTKFPVIPPVYRPVYPGPNGGPPMIADLNNLYKDLIMTNEALHELKDFPDEHKETLRKALHNAAGAVIGVCDPVNDKSKKQELKGGLTQLVGANNSKEGFFHKKILYRTQDLTGRGTILPDPNLHVDECKIPEDMAKEMYKPFVVKRLVEAGLEPSKALKEANDHTESAQRALKEEMEHRPLLLNRAPTLHKYGILAFKPKAVKGKSIFIPPLVISGFGADFDGDSVGGDTWVIVKDEKGKVHLVRIKDVV